MSLSAGTFQPYLKPNARPVYINVGSNHPPQIIKNVPPSVNQRLCSISCNEQVFRDAAKLYQDALTASGHTATLQYTPRPDNTLGGPRRKRQQTRNVIWYTPPFSQSVKTNVGGKFLKLVAKHFPQGSRLHKIFNKNTVKIGYSCVKNMAAIIRSHNATLLRPEIPDKPCNCRKTECSLNGKCRAEGVVYEATVTSSNAVKKYVGMTATEFKARYANHKTSIRHERYGNATELSKY